MQVGETIGNFLILDELGAGGMGAVYIGYKEGSRTLVVIKTLFQQWAKEEQMVKRFLREAEVYRKLDHPNIVHFVDSGNMEGTYYIAMEHVRSSPLDDILKKKGALAIETAVKILGHLADAVAHAHERGIIHRDLKPQNIMYSEDGVLKLLDFGIAKTEDELLKTTEGSVLGTYLYASPEQNQGKEVDLRSDLYALGAILFELVTGKRPFKGSSLLEVTAAQIKGDLTMPTVLNSKVPKGLERIILKLMQKDPKNRYATAKDLIYDLEKFKEDPDGFDPSKLFDDEELVEKWELAKAAFQKGADDQALDLCKQVEAQRKDSAEIYVLMGKVQARKKFKPLAKKSFLRALELEPDNLEYRLDYGIMLATILEFDEAQKQFQQVLEIEPENMYALSHMRKLDGQRRAAEQEKEKQKAVMERIAAQEAAAAAGGEAPPSLDGPAKKTTPAAAAPAPVEAGARAVKMSRVWWGLGYWILGRKAKFLWLSLIEVGVLVALIGPLVMPFPAIQLDLVRTVQQIGLGALAEPVGAWQKSGGTAGLLTVLGKNLRWIIVGLAALTFLLMEIRIPRRIAKEASGS